MTKRLAAIAMLVAAAAGCDENLSDFAGPTPNLTATFTSIQRDIFNANDSSGRPACTSCHNAQRAQFNGNLNLSGSGAYAELVNAPSSRKAGATRVIPGDPDASYMVQKIEGAPGIVGARMPLNGPFLSSGQVTIIRRWIEQGAQNN
jgi:cytochrome c peroxidase